tara:strand:+ start:252 stop:524 length:273 start_codon:yes stop_codon:yes gene_type:complete
MAYKVKKSDLQYDYNWERDPGDSPSTGWQDDVKVDKDEGYEMLYLIQSFVTQKGWFSDAWVSSVETYLHSDELSNVQSRKRLLELLSDNF